MKDLLARIALLGGLLVVLLALGYAWGHARAQHAGDMVLAKARSDTQVCASADTAKALAIGELEQQLQRAYADKALLRQMSDLALKARDLQIQRLQREVDQRGAALERLSHDDPDCRALARVSVCPAVARRLWGKPAGDHHAP